MAFLTIEPTANLAVTLLERAIKDWPPEVVAEAPHEQMLASAGFTDIEVVDVTAEFSRTQQAWIDAWRVHERELLALLGEDAMNERKTDRQAMRSAIDEGLLRRTQYIARAPNRRSTTT